MPEKISKFYSYSIKILNILKKDKNLEFLNEKSPNLNNNSPILHENSKGVFYLNLGTKESIFEGAFFCGFTISRNLKNNIVSIKSEDFCDNIDLNNIPHNLDQKVKEILKLSQEAFKICINKL